MHQTPGELQAFGGAGSPPSTCTLIISEDAANLRRRFTGGEAKHIWLAPLGLVQSWGHGESMVAILLDDLSV